MATKIVANPKTGSSIQSLGAEHPFSVQLDLEEKMQRIRALFYAIANLSEEQSIDSNLLFRLTSMGDEYANNVIETLGLAIV